MGPENYNELLGLIKEDISKVTTHLREVIPPKIKLAITIRFLATGNSDQGLSTCFQVHKSTIGKFVPEVCDALYRKLKDNYLKVFYHTCLSRKTFKCLNISGDDNLRKGMVGDDN